MWKHSKIGIFWPHVSYSYKNISTLRLLPQNVYQSLLFRVVSPQSFFHVALIVSSLTLQVNVRLSPAVSAVYWSGTTWAEAFPTLRKRQLIKILVHIRHPQRQHQCQGHVIVIIIKLIVNTQCCGGTSCICFMFRFTLVSIQIVRFNMSSRIKRLEWTTEFAIS